MASGVAYRVMGVPGMAHVFPLGSATKPSILMGDPNALGGLDDGFYGTSTGFGYALNGVSIFEAGSQGLGYQTGSGGTVSQQTDRTTAVTLNTLCGQITTQATSLAAAAEVEFTVNNTKVAATDTIIVNITPGGTGTPQAYVSNVSANSFKITITNLHSATADTSADVINFAVIKAVAA